MIYNLKIFYVIIYYGDDYMNILKRLFDHEYSKLLSTNNGEIIK